MDSLSSQTSAFKDVNGKYHDTQDQADKASAQIMLDKANPGGTLSIQALANLYATNPQFKAYVDKQVDLRVEQIKQEAQNQVGQTETSAKPKK